MSEEWGFSCRSLPGDGRGTGVGTVCGKNGGLRGSVRGWTREGPLVEGQSPGDGDDESNGFCGDGTTSGGGLETIGSPEGSRDLFVCGGRDQGY